MKFLKALFGAAQAQSKPQSKPQLRPQSELHSEPQPGQTEGQAAQTAQGAQAAQTVQTAQTVQRETTLSARQAKANLDAGQALFVLDVRQPAEFQSGHIAGARLIPLDELARRIDELPKDRDILCVCRSGARSGAAARQLARAGYRAINMQGGMISWQNAGYPVKKGK